MLQTLISIIGILITIFFVIGTHEYAHFITARCLGVKILRFSIGFGKSLLRWHDKYGTEYVIALIPLGGYVKMLDESEGDVPKEEVHLAYNHQPFYKKFLIVLAGPLANIICAFILYWLIFMIGFVAIKPIIGDISARSIAAEGGLKPNQEIISIDHKVTASWTGVVFRILAHSGDEDKLAIEVRNLSNNQLQTHILDLSNWHLDSLTPDAMGSLGIKPYEPSIPLIIGVIKKESPAAAASLHLGDKIIAINGKKPTDWNDVITFVLDHPAQTSTWTLERSKRIVTLPVTIGYKRDWLLQKYGYLGMGPDFQIPKEMIHQVQYGPITAIPHAWQQISDFTYFNLLLLGKLVTGKLSVKSLGGPITIFESAGTALNYGFLAFIGFLAFLSISIGIINLLPIPGLDGGHLFIQIIEYLIGRPIPEKILLVLYRFGLLLILFVLIQALINDILRL